MESVSVSVNILGRTYRLRVAAGDEAALRKAALTIESQAKQYGNMYAYNDHQDLLAMVALTQITQLTKIQDSLRYKDTDLAERLQSIDNVLEGILHPTTESQNSL
ncbi:MAG: cell division protein ZapA [Bacteroidales bacterium]|jgi:cell division protein ZapA (FtsZ GTPase activity inhibitor)|nr:cell division protein ZapA [Bacteroidales bacterium]